MWIHVPERQAGCRLLGSCKLVCKFKFELLASLHEREGRAAAACRLCRLELTTANMHTEHCERVMLRDDLLIRCT